MVRCTKMIWSCVWTFQLRSPWLAMPTVFFEVSYMLGGVPKLFALVDVYTRMSSTSWSSNDAQVMLLSLSAFKGTFSCSRLSTV